ncbi:hypothetical protein TNCV_3374631 [Trichonephila clavipes]|nr:hypothetical protein TNCV_3374631 [Trichonephila clavipes]
MSSRLSLIYEFSFSQAAEFASARAPKFSPVCVSERKGRICNRILGVPATFYGIMPDDRNMHGQRCQSNLQT